MCRARRSVCQAGQTQDSLYHPCSTSIERTSKQIELTNPLLRLNDQTPVLLNTSRALIRLDRDAPILAIARVQLQTLLVGPQGQSDPRVDARPNELRRVHRLRTRAIRSVEDERIVDPGAPDTALLGVKGSISDQFRAGEVERHGRGLEWVLDGLETASGYLEGVDRDDSVGVGHLEGVVKDGGLLEGSEVPVDVVGEHDWGVVVKGYGDNPAGQARWGRYREGDVCHLEGGHQP
jgi:hypothetical protein